MANINVKNERIKRKFFQWLKEADGCSDSTIYNIERAILHYEDFTRHADFATFNSDKAIEFKKWLIKKESRGKTISLTTYHTYLRYLMKFFRWLSWQSGYKSKITPDIIDYLKISDKEKRIATQSNPVKYPSLEHVVELADSIRIQSEIDFRDRALISFTLLSGMRVNAIMTLPLGCFDKEKLIINQDPKLGVQTKFSKTIPSMLFKFDDRLFDHFMKWVDRLETKGFCPEDPLFPRSKLERCEGGLSFESAIEVEPAFWQSTGTILKIFIERSKEAGLEYFPPHTFRHLAIVLAFKQCKTGEEIKAVSQNFGHEHVATTFSSYGNFEPDRLSEILTNMDFSGEPSISRDEKIDEIYEILIKKNAK